MPVGIPYRRWAGWRQPLCVKLAHRCLMRATTARWDPGLPMIRAKKVRPVLRELPAESKLPIDALDAAKIGKAGGAALVVSGTVIEAVESHSSNSANTGGLMGNLGVGGSLSRSTARVSLNIELVDAETGETVKNFEVSAKNTDVGLGADFSTTLGSMDLGGGAGDKTPMAKALREAARKVNEEVAKVAVKRR